MTDDSKTTPTPAPGLDLDAVEAAAKRIIDATFNGAKVVQFDDQQIVNHATPALIAEVRSLRARLAEAKRLGLEFVALHREAGNCDGWGPAPGMRSKRMAAIVADLEAL